MDEESINISDSNTSNIRTTNYPDMLNSMGAEKGTNTWSLHPREHMDRLSEYGSNT